MKPAIAIIATALLCTMSDGKAASSEATIYTSQTAPYANEGVIAKAILEECRLPQRQAELIEQAAKENGIVVVRDDDAVAAKKGRVLVVEISNALSMGNAFTGHRKQVSVRGRLLEDGTEVGNFIGQRSSMGGAFAGFKGSCLVLERCLSTLAKDINGWLKSPTMNARIGE
jgi:hypothetical protein